MEHQSGNNINAATTKEASSSSTTKNSNTEINFDKTDTKCQYDTSINYDLELQKATKKNYQTIINYSKNSIESNHILNQNFGKAASKQK